MPLNPAGIYYADNSTNMSIADITAAMADSIGDIINQVVTTAIPPGIVAESALPGAPSGWLLCRGQAISRTTYADLFAAIGTTWGAGDGSTTFNVPDIQGRVTVGQSVSGTFAALNNKGGAETVTLTEAQMPSHTHTDAGHVHASQYPNNTGGGTGYFGGLNNTIQTYQTGVTYNGTLTQTGNANIQYTGGSQAHTNLQPYIVVNYIIKY